MLASYSNCIFTNTADGTAYASSSSEVSLLTGLNIQPFFPAGFWNDDNRAGKAVRLIAAGILSTTGTPTIQWTIRLNTTAGVSNVAGDIMGITAAITTASGVSNKQWRLEFDMMLRTPGIGTTTATMSCNGRVSSEQALPSPFMYAIQPTTPESATWTKTFDGGVNTWLNLTATWGTNSASNTMTLKEMMCLVLN